MDQERWERIQTIFHQVADRPESGREEFLETACGGDVALLADVESLLHEDARGASLLDRDLRGIAHQVLDTPHKSLPPDEFGPYRIKRLLGEGGMGVVYLAEREDLGSLVAIKVLRDAWLSPARLDRFEREQKMLANLNHPSIARLYDADCLANGTPWFVMEYVEGVSLTDYCRAHGCSIEDRLRLFRSVCEAVQYSHALAIIHRDLKPSNILVKADGTVKLLDFGIAKQLENLDGPADPTKTALQFMTPAYAAPEQLQGSGTDTRSDVYSLGVVLYELLAGRLPFDLPKKTPAEAELAIVHSEAERPSVAAARLPGVRAAKGAWNDLDVLCLKAMHKDPGRRYRSVEALIRDIDHFLRGEPLEARPDSLRYWAGKFVNRHRIGVAFAGGLVLLLGGVVTMQVVQARRVMRERDRAARITDFMKGMFKVSDPSEARGNSITAREILDRASNEINTGLAEDPGTQGQLLDVMGDVYQSLGLLSRAQPLLERAVDIQRQASGPRAPETLRSMDDLAWLLFNEGHYAEAEQGEREMLATSRQVLGPDNPETLIAMRHLAADLHMEGRYAEAEKLEREALAIERRVLAPENLDTLRTMANLAATLLLEGRYAEAERLNRELLGIQRRVLGTDHPSTIATIGNLAMTLTQEGRYAEAEKSFRELLEVQRRVFGPEHPSTLRTIAGLASTLADEGRPTDAEKLQRELLEIQRRVLGPEHPGTLGTISNLALTLGDEGHYAEAEKLQRGELDIQRRVLGPENPATLATMSHLASNLAKQGWYAESERLRYEVLGIQRRVLGPDDPETAQSVYWLGSLAALQGRKDEAFSLLREAVDHGLYPVDDLGIYKDTDLKALHGDPRFTALVADANDRVETVQKPH